MTNKMKDSLKTTSIVKQKDTLN